MYAANSTDVSLAFTSWIAEEMREIAQEREEAVRESHRPFPAILAGTFAAAFLATFKFMVP
ncbi:hypothetical protein V22_06880 [Calycomorphotria hydatis]|uniref:Uncharacterized protein n=1 Tax=Calycomorphotria hydatis TaxID=2528027 RepID=A0A517T509_9PLAN|nr:hypothetical protein V22_06880 [Calycomorphotria hydatis]